MTQDDIQTTLLGVFRKVFSDEDIVISEEMTAADYEAWDSLNHIMLIMETEATFGVKFSNAEVARLQKVGDLIKLVAGKLG